MSAVLEQPKNLEALRRSADRKVDAAAQMVRRLEVQLAQDLSDEAEFEDELIEGFIGRQAMSVLYGDSNSGKTFLAIDIAAAVCQGQQWMGRNVDAGMVVYLATESPRSVCERLKAYHAHHRMKLQNFVVVKSPINLYESEADTTAVVALIREMETLHGAKCELVVGDTLARLSAGANENSGEDMGVVVRHVDRIRQEAAVHFMLIHHSGKDAARGMRGWSGLRAATDTEVEITANETTGNRAAEVTKQRDMAGKGERIGFRLHTIEMGTGKWGQPRTSCVVTPIDAPAPVKKLPRLGGVQQAILGVLRGHGADMRTREIASTLEGQYGKTSVYNAVERLKDLALIEVSAGIVHLIK